MLQTDTQGSSFGHLARRLDRAVERMVRGQFSHFSPTECWVPAINAYRLSDRIEVCVDLAGVRKDSVTVHAEAAQLTIRGLRQPPQPHHEASESIQILAMEIDHGPFERIVRLPAGVDVQNISAKTETGLLWIRLPLRESAR